MDKIPAAITILVGTGIVAIIAGFNEQLGHFLFVFMLIIALMWLLGGGVQGDLTKWTGTLTGNTNTGTGPVLE